VLLAREERWDGGGHPRGLRADAIPLGARILAAVDELCRMTDGSPYRPALSTGRALEELSMESGRRLDPRVVAVLGELLADDEAAGFPSLATGAEEAA